MNAQLEFQASASQGNISQCDRLEIALREAGEGIWVAMPTLARAMSNGGQGTGICVSRRIYDLRHRLEKSNQTIEQRSEWRDGVNHSFYRLIRLDDESKSKSTSMSKIETLAPAPALALAPPSVPSTPNSSRPHESIN